MRWLGFDWGDNLFHASDYFEQLYAWAVDLIEQGLAYVDDQSADETRESRGTLTSGGVNSPYRDRPVAENLDLFARMRAGEFENGARVLRAKIDMASPNINLRDPVLYRIVHAPHPRTGDAWCIYPTYDMAHGQSDAIEGVTHSLCTLEFENHRPLYDWLIEHLPVPHVSRQYEFARLSLTCDRALEARPAAARERGPRARLGRPPDADDLGAAPAGLPGRGHPRLRSGDRRLEGGQRPSRSSCSSTPSATCSNRTAPRRFGVLDPLKVVITTIPRGRPSRWRSSTTRRTRRPARARSSSRASCGSSARTSWRSRSPKFFRLSPGREVRLRSAYFITCQEVVKDDAGRVVELRCTYDPATRGGDSPDGRKVKATLHWVSAAHAVPAEVRLYDHLFVRPDPGADGDLFADLNPASETIVRGAMLEPTLAGASLGETVQFERLGYFTPDADSRPDALVFNRTMTLKDSWAKAQAQG